jgi:RNA polymerase sigma factor (sigma-70 family)
MDRPAPAAVSSRPTTRSPRASARGISSATSRSGEMATFVQTYASLISHLARRAGGTRSRGTDSEDISQEVILALLNHKRAHVFDEMHLQNPKAYLRVIVRNAAIRSWRRAALERRADEAEVDGPPPDSVPTPEDAARRAIDARRTLDALRRQLRPCDALALSLLVEERLAIEEVAERLGTTLNNVYQIRHRILAAVREIRRFEPRPSAVAEP